MVSNVTPSIPGLPLFLLASAYASRRVSSLLTCTNRPQNRHSGSAVATTTPECRSASASLRCGMLPSSPLCGLGLRGKKISWPPVRSLSLRPGDSPATLSGGCVGELQFISFLPPCHPSYEVLALSSAGLSPAERASLCWTHIRRFLSPRPSPTGSADGISTVATMCPRGALSYSRLKKSADKISPSIFASRNCIDAQLLQTTRIEDPNSPPCPLTPIQVLGLSVPHAGRPPWPG